jgi:hypothetical protein
MDLQSVSGLEAVKQAAVNGALIDSIPESGLNRRHYSIDSTLGDSFLGHRNHSESISRKTDHMSRTGRIKTYNSTT